MVEGTVTNVGENEPYRFNCSEVLDISSASQLQSSLLKALESKRPIELVATEIERADTSALQIFIAFFQDAHAQDIPVKWIEPSEALCQSARLLGVLEMIQLQTDAV